MSLQSPSAFWPCVMLISAIFIAMWLAKKKNPIIDVAAGVLTAFIVLCIVLSFHLF